MLWFLFGKILYMSAAATCGGFLIYIFSKIFSKVLSKKTVYYLWLLPLLAAVIPFSNGYIPKTAARQFNSHSASSYQTKSAEKQTSTAYIPVKDEAKSADNINAGDISRENSGEISALSLPKLPALTMKKIISFAYIFFALLMLLRFGIKTQKFGRKMRSMEKEIYSPRYSDYARESGYFKNFRICTASLDCSPFVYGTFKPKIILPSEETEKEVFIHELTHIKRHDTLYLFFLNIIKCLHFFNPFIYFFVGEIKRYMELSCDESVAFAMNDEERLAYGKSIINYSAKGISCAVCLSENGKNIKERIKIIMEKKKRSKFAKTLSFMLAALIIFGQTAFAAAIGTKAPKKSYVINHTNKAYSLVYTRPDEKTFWSRRSGINESSAVLINSELFKGFTADLKLELSSLRRDTDDAFDAEVHIEMDKFIKDIGDGKNWQGLFTVTINGETVLSEAKGYLNDIPGDYSRDVSRLLITDGKTAVEVERIDFDTKSDDAINAEYEEWEKEHFTPDLIRRGNGNASISCSEDGKTETYQLDWTVVLKVNRREGKLYCREIPFLKNYFIQTVPGEKYKFSGDTAKGKFYLLYSGGIKTDMFEGTLSGIEKKDTITLTSSDKSIKVTMNAGIIPDENDVRYSFPMEGEWKGLNNGLEDGSDFAKNCINKVQPTTLDKLPFTLELNEDKTKVILKLKDGFNPDGWFYSYSSYTSTDEDVYNKYTSEYGGRETELDLCSLPLSSHNLQFNYYVSSPYAFYCYTDIMFKISDGRILYSNCENYITENSNYSGDEAKKMLDKYLLASKKYMFD